MSLQGLGFLQNFMKNNTPLRSLVDAASLGYTDFDKKGDDNVQKGIKRGIAGFGDIVTGNRYDFDKKGSNAKIAAGQVKEFEQELGDPLNRDQYNKDFRNMMVTNSLLRRGELAAERRENLNFMRSMYPLLEQAGRNQLERAIEGDQRSPTKISQQILRAKQGEAALMNAIANQTTSAAQVGNIGTSRRYGRG